MWLIAIIFGTDQAVSIGCLQGTDKWKIRCNTLMDLEHQLAMLCLSLEQDHIFLKTVKQTKFCQLAVPQFLLVFQEYQHLHVVNTSKATLAPHVSTFRPSDSIEQ